LWEVPTFMNEGQRDLNGTAKALVGSVYDNFQSSSVINSKKRFAIKEASNCFIFSLAALPNL